MSVRVRLLRRSPALLVFFALLISGGSMLGVGDPTKEILPALHSSSINWEAIGAISVIGFGFLSGTWFVVSLSTMSIVAASEQKLRAEISDPQTGYVPRELCKIIHEKASGHEGRA